MNDTTEEIKNKQRDIWLAKSEEERLLDGLTMMEEGKYLIQIGILNEHSGISAIDLQIETFKRMYRNDFSEEEMNTIFESFKKFYLKNKSQNRTH